MAYQKAEGGRREEEQGRKAGRGGRRETEEKEGRRRRHRYPRGTTYLSVEEEEEGGVCVRTLVTVCARKWGSRIVGPWDWHAPATRHAFSKYVLVPE